MPPVTPRTTRVGGAGRPTGKHRPGRTAADAAQRSDWPQQEFLAWLDATKEVLGIPSDNQLAEYLGIGHTLISGWRLGRQRPSMDKLNQIAMVVEEDPRRLWVLAGVADPVEVGLVDDAGPGLPEEPIPDEILDLIDLYRNRRDDESTRQSLVEHVAILVAGLRANMPDRAAERE